MMCWLVRRLILVLALLLGWLAPVHAIGPALSPAPEAKTLPAPADQAKPAILVYLAAYRANGPPVVVVAVWSASPSARASMYAYSSGDPVTQAADAHLA